MRIGARATVLLFRGLHPPVGWLQQAGERVRQLSIVKKKKGAGRSTSGRLPSCTGLERVLEADVVRAAQGSDLVVGSVVVSRAVEGRLVVRRYPIEEIEH